MTHAPSGASVAETSASELARQDIAAHLHPYTNLAAHAEVGPMVIRRGDGIFIEDERGRRYLEAMAGLWCASLGFSNRRLAQAGAQALATLPNYHTFNHRSNPATIELAERLAQRLLNTPVQADRAKPPVLV